VLIPTYRRAAGADLTPDVPGGYAPGGPGEKKECTVGFLDKVKDTANKGVEKGKQGVKLGQEKIDAAKLKKRVGELKEELGGVVYAQRTGTGAADADAEITRLVGEIQAAEQELADDATAAG